MLSVAFSPKGNTIVSASGDIYEHGGTNTLKVWGAGACTLTPASLELKATKPNAHRDRVTSVAFSPDGKTIVSGSADKALKVWDAGVLALTPSNP